MPEGKVRSSRFLLYNYALLNAFAQNKNLNLQNEDAAKRFRHFVVSFGQIFCNVADEYVEI